MRNLKGVFHGGYCNAYFPFQVVATSVRIEQCLPLCVIANKISAIPNQKGPPTDMLNIFWELPMLHGQAVMSICSYSTIRRSVTAAQSSAKGALKYSTWTQTGEQPRL